MPLSYDSVAEKVSKKRVPAKMRRPEQRRIGPLRGLERKVHYPKRTTIFNPARYLLPNKIAAATIRVWRVNDLLLEVIGDGYKEEGICGECHDPCRRGEWELEHLVTDTQLLADVGKNMSNGLRLMAVRFYHVHKWLVEASASGIATGVYAAYVKVCKGDELKHYLLTASARVQGRVLEWSLELHNINLSDRPNLEPGVKILFY